MGNIFDFGGGGTYFGPPILMGMQKIDEYIANKEFAKFYFFTDGGASYPSAEMQ